MATQNLKAPATPGEKGNDHAPTNVPGFGPCRDTPTVELLYCSSSSLFFPGGTPVARSVPRLKSAGARGIVEYPLNKVIE